MAGCSPLESGPHSVASHMWLAAARGMNDDVEGARLVASRIRHLPRFLEDVLRRSLGTTVLRERFYDGLDRAGLRGTSFLGA